VRHSRQFYCFLAARAINNNCSAPRANSANKRATIPSRQTHGRFLSESGSAHQINFLYTLTAEFKGTLFSLRENLKFQLKITTGKLRKEKFYSLAATFN
jgi:hypothetical protein